MPPLLFQLHRWILYTLPYFLLTKSFSHFLQPFVLLTSYFSGVYLSFPFTLMEATYNGRVLCTWPIKENVASPYTARCILLLNGFLRFVRRPLFLLPIILQVPTHCSSSYSPFPIKQDSFIQHTSTLPSFESFVNFIRFSILVILLTLTPLFATILRLWETPVASLPHFSLPQEQLDEDAEGCILNMHDVCFTKKSVCHFDSS